MKVLFVLLSISSVALASLEPPGYRSPASAGSSQYLPPHFQQDHQHQHDYQQHEQHQQSQTSNAESSQYLQPTYNSPSVPEANPSSQYLPPTAQQQSPLTPSSNYLPAADKPQQTLRPIVVPAAPASDYLPPHLSGVTGVPASEYLPPVTRTQGSARTSSTPAAPAEEYLPPLVNAPRNSLEAVPAPKSEYLPPHLGSQSTLSPATPESDYLPPSRQGSSTSPRVSSTTPVPRITVVSVSPYKLDGPIYTSQRTAQSKHSSSGSGLITSATSARGFTQAARGYSSDSSSGYPSASKGYPSGYEQPADNYLPPASRVDDAGRTGSDQSGYRYDTARSAAAAAATASRVEQSTVPAKYDFEYRVSDEYGNDYSHKESRAGSRTHGSYSVLLPDGRKQIVEYEADEHGFKPRISYEEAATVLGPKAAQAGYDGNANNLDTAHGPY